MITYIESLAEQEKEMAKTLITPFIPESKDMGGVYTVKLNGKRRHAESLREAQEILQAWQRGEEPTFSLKQAITWKYQELSEKSKDKV